jgi:hypothetical protein
MTVDGAAAGSSPGRRFMSSHEARQSTDEQALRLTPKEMGTRQRIRWYLERLAFTDRGRFAFVVGMLYSIFEAASRTGLRDAVSGDQSELLANATPTVRAAMEHGLAGLGGVVTVLIGILAGLVVLLMLDIYEQQVGIIVADE